MGHEASVARPSVASRATSAPSSASAPFLRLRQKLCERIFGQKALIDALLVAIVARGHVLLEGPPGVGKTSAVTALAAHTGLDVRRIQLNPDVLPSDILGAEIFYAQVSEFRFQPGPIFHSLVIADELNRAPPKVQSALLEAMAERQVTVAGQTYALPELFTVMATQNSLEHEGTYPLPDSELDRFMLRVRVRYPDAAAEQQLLARHRLQQQEGEGTHLSPLLHAGDLLRAQTHIWQLHLSPPIERYILELVLTTREPSRHGLALKVSSRLGVSPRGTLALEAASRAHAFLEGRDYVAPEDVLWAAPWVLAHRWSVDSALDASSVQHAMVRELLRAVPLP